MIIISQVLFIVIAFVSGIFAALLVTKHKVFYLDQQTLNKHTNEITKNPKPELLQGLTQITDRETEQLHKKSQDILEEEKRIKQDIINRNLPRKILRFSRDIHRLENQLEQSRHRKKQIEHELVNLNSQSTTYQLLSEEINNLSKEIEKIELSTKKLKEILASIEIFTGEQFTRPNPQLAKRMRDRNRKPLISQ
ncbi:hypothetical protein [Calothrix sp. NIES-2098]|uniref:hypothetical protein n=1 Tax=Calothrix sp. NIES-2098 TaxID=1954171 RepID=UPI000B60AD8F|nr:hypothetical protein NIES2098_02040 [Calothrix sp. NIES-2098]